MRLYLHGHIVFLLLLSLLCWPVLMSPTGIDSWPSRLYAVFFELIVCIKLSLLIQTVTR
ncbi:uncharacterized protein BDV14DRAFT_184683, partial [Aspergillus stella-maris]|uniref:uncharacterized protein n=1 Tax=Aspergillus stella-maris TaxID=1810926 RepID=UPI003CCCCC50